MRRLAAAAVLALLAAAVPAQAARPDAVLPLHAAPDPGPRGGRLVDRDGREVLLRGVNVNALAEYWRGSAFPTTFPLDRGDPALMASIGWNAVRLLVSWSRVEPQRGVYDEAYLDQVADHVRRLEREGIATILDLHQDAWGPTLAAPPGTTCPPGSSPALGWDGAPAWATLDDGLPRCAPGDVREASPAVRQAWQSFWADRDGIRTAYTAMAAHLGARFATTRGVVGLDVMNEPNAFGPAENVALSDLYGDTVRALRAAAFRGLVLFEPSALWSAIGRGAPPDFPRDRDVVYAPHVYTGGFDDGPITADAFQVARDEARGFGGAPVLSGEWGADPARVDYFAEHQRLQDQFAFSATLWTWRESCGDPHKVGDLRAGRVPRVWGEFEVDCRTNAVTGRRAATIAALTRGYVRAAPGRLDATHWDPADRTLTASGTAGAAPKADLTAFVPGPRADVTATRGLRAVRVIPTSGAGRLLVARPTGGAWSLVVSSGAEPRRQTR
jgi:endoglycosylceramidase